MKKEFAIMDDEIALHAKLDTPEKKETYPLLILVHGLTGHMEERHLTAVAKAVLEEGFGVLRVEMYGHGQSGGRFEEHTIFKWISNIMKVTDYAKAMSEVTDLYLCGHSQGGLLTMLAAGMRPDDYKAVTPMSPALVILDGAREGRMLGMEFDPDHIPDVIAYGDLRFSGNYYRTAQYLHIEDAIRRYHKPVLLIHGEGDQAVPAEYSVKANEQYENSRLILLPDDDHGYHLHLDVVCDEIVRFLKENEEMAA